MSPDSRGGVAVRQVFGEVVSNQPLTGEYWLLEIDAPVVAKDLRAGQFINIRMGDGFSPYLRRPFSVYRLGRDRASLQIAYKIVGIGTELMTTSFPAGSPADILGPLGRGFALPDAARRIALVGRGIGNAALPILAEEAGEKGIEVYSFLSARNTPNLAGVEVFEELSHRVFIHTDDQGDVDMVTDHLEALLPDTPFDAIYVCGSKRLTREAHAMATRLGIPAQVALEQYMACGFGDCHGCVVEVNLDRDASVQAYHEVCTYGPVFDTWEVIGAHT
jgi:dihydroorotate dehydrogenase electron transfer subunit